MLVPPPLGRTYEQSLPISRATDANEENKHVKTPSLCTIPFGFGPPGFHANKGIASAKQIRSDKEREGEVLSFTFGTFGGLTVKFQI